MTYTSETRNVVLDLLEEQALVVGGLVVMHEVDDDFVWRLFSSFDAIRRKVLRELGEPVDSSETATSRPVQPHPAIEDFLRRVRASV